MENFHQVAATRQPASYETGYRFEYATLTAHGVEDSASDVGPAPPTSQFRVSGLSPSTTYHYRLVAVRDGSVAATGDDQTFTTPSPVRGRISVPTISVRLPSIRQ
jgi:hypothetical protein